MEGAAQGDLEEIGRWHFSYDGRQLDAPRVSQESLDVIARSVPAEEPSSQGQRTSGGHYEWDGLLGLPRPIGSADDHPVGKVILFATVPE